MSDSTKQPDQIAVYLELGAKRVFASAASWPGWCRSGKDEQQAIAALVTAAPRYSLVARAAGIDFPTVAESSFLIVERLPGSATTDFGAPASIASGENEPLSPKETDRLTRLLKATWSVFDRIVASAPAELRKGPRGGGRNRDRVVEHVVGAEVMYARKLGIKTRDLATGDTSAVAALRDSIASSLGSPVDPAKSAGSNWPARYAARRIA